MVHYKSRQTAFTLIELLVVIAIIAILMGILMPVLSRVRAQGRAAVCKANLRSWGMVWRMYSDEYNGMFAPGNRVGWARGDWVLSLRKYWEDKDQILLCPSAKQRLVTVGGMQPYGDAHHSYVQGDYQGEEAEECSYGYNLWLFTLPENVPELQGRPRDLHFRSMYDKQMTNVPLFLDSMWRGGGPWYGSADGRSNNPSFAGIRPSGRNGWLGSRKNSVLVLKPTIAKLLPCFCFLPGSMIWRQIRGRSKTFMLPQTGAFVATCPSNVRPVTVKETEQVIGLNL